MTGMSKFVLISSGTLAAMAGIGYLAFRSLTGSTPVPANMHQVSLEDRAISLQRRGAYLLAALDCNACHSAHDQNWNLVPGSELAGHPATAPLPEWDPSLLKRNALMTMAPTGTAFAGPWGVSVAPNLTPDKETGIGSMTAEQLIASWRSNHHWNIDRPILPPMPAPAYAALTDDDIRAIHAYLMSLPPVKNKVPASVIAAPPPAAK